MATRALVESGKTTYRELAREASNLDLPNDPNHPVRKSVEGFITGLEGFVLGRERESVADPTIVGRFQAILEEQQAWLKAASPPVAG